MPSIGRTGRGILSTCFHERRDLAATPWWGVRISVATEIRTTGAGGLSQR